jgi:hypothetical protein
MDIKINNLNIHFKNGKKFFSKDAWAIVYANLQNKEVSTNISIQSNLTNDDYMNLFNNKEPLISEFFSFEYNNKLYTFNKKFFVLYYEANGHIIYIEPFSDMDLNKNEKLDILDNDYIKKQIEETIDRNKKLAKNDLYQDNFKKLIKDKNKKLVELLKKY